MELTYLRTFREVVKTGSYTKAAEALGYAQSSVTTQIQKLEESYGAVLLERHGRGMKLTMAGEALLPYAEQLARLHDESREVVSQQSKGTLAVGTIETLAAFFLPPYLQAYRERFPEVNVTLHPGNEPYLIEEVKSGALDVGFILDPPYVDPELHTEILREEELVIIAQPGHRFAGMTEIRAEHLEDESLILTEDGCTYRAMLLRLLKTGQIRHRLAYEFGNLEAIKQCVAYGLGVALLPRITVETAVGQGQLVAVPFKDPACRFYSQLIYAKKKWQPAAFKGFLELLLGKEP